MPAWIGVGSNLNDPVTQVNNALAALADFPETRLLASSGLYRNPPMGGLQQPEYVNAVAGLLTRLEPQRLLQLLQATEAAAGRDRQRETRWGSRPLDLDLLTYGIQRIDVPGLRVPHPGIADRNFVLLPLAEIAPGLQIPGVGPVWQLAARMDAGNMQLIG